MTAAEGRGARRALLVGGTGFVGRHLVRQLAGRWGVTASGRARDVRDAAGLRALIEEVRPDAVVNLAALTTVRETVDDPDAARAVTVDGLANLLEALAAFGFTGRLLQVGSSEVYGHPGPEALPLTEASPTDPKSPYAQAKIEAEALCQAWRGRLDIVIARPFTHIGPGQSDRFAVASWARQLAQIGEGIRKPELAVGALDATRDLTDVRDVVRAYEALLDRGQAGGVYNVCSGRERAMREVLGALIAESGLSVRVVNDPARLRAAEQKRLLGSHARLTADTGWTPAISLSQTLSDILRDARAQVREEAQTA